MEEALGMVLLFLRDAIVIVVEFGLKPSRLAGPVPALIPREWFTECFIEYVATVTRLIAMIGWVAVPFPAALHDFVTIINDGIFGGGKERVHPEAIGLLD